MDSGGVTLRTKGLCTLRNVTKNVRWVQLTKSRTEQGVWQGVAEKDVDIMIRLQKSLQGHLQIAKQMLKHIPGKTAKQIRDKRKEPSHKALVEQHASTHLRPTTPEPHESICSSSDSEIEARPVYTRRYISETEDKLLSDGGEVSRQPNPRPR